MTQQMPPEMVNQQWTLTQHIWEHVHAVLECTSSSLCLEIAEEVGILSASVFCILTEHLKKWKTCAKWIPHVLRMMINMPCMSCCPPPISNVVRGREIHFFTTF
jgi:hypothetical protein